MLRAAYRDHRGHAKSRGIEFLLTFSEWLTIWEASGKLAERGRTSGKYCMARFGDKGPYAVGNVEIKTINKNISEAWNGKKRPFRSKPDDHRARIANALRDKPKDPRVVQKIADAKRGKPLQAIRTLTVDDVLKIRALHKSGMSYYKIAREIGAHGWTVNMIISGKTYQDVR